MTVQITILGLGQLGSSIGLALANAKDQVLRVGSDKEPEVSKQAQKVGAVDKIAYSLPDAASTADVVILALPAGDVRFTLETIAPHLKAGAVVLDTSPVTVQSSQWARELITAEDRYFLTFTPAANARYLYEIDQGPASAHADLFKDNVIMLTSGPGVDPSAITLAENLAHLLGGVPIFSDPHEVDGLLSTSHVLPALLATAYVNMAADQAGWGDGRKIAGARFAHVGQLVEVLGAGKEPAAEVLHNRENVLRAVDSLLNELHELRDEIAESNAEQLNSRFENARQAYQLWTRQRASGKWEERIQSSPMYSFGESVGRMFGIRPKRPKEKDAGKN
jgi:prephenate dehydrogenase